jgi:AcrR family transcriptional regulator
MPQARTKAKPKKLDAPATRGQKRKSRREEFLHAAAAVFAEHGLRGATMDDVAKQAGVAKVILYRHFPSKEDLIHELLGRVAKTLLEVDQNHPEGYFDSSRKALEAARQDPDGYLLLMRDARFDPVFAQHCDLVRRSVADRLEGAFKRLGLDPILCRLSAETVTTYVLGSIATWVETGDPANDDVFLRWLAAGSRAMDLAWRARFAV